MKRSSIAALVVFFSVGAVVAQQDLVTTRIGIMKANARTMYGNLNQMVKEAKPYDQAAEDAALAQLADSVPKIGPLYADSTKGLKSPDSDFSATAKVWETKADFDAHVASLIKAVSDAKAKITSLDTLKVSYAAINNECNSCHETYRVKN